MKDKTVPIDIVKDRLGLVSDAALGRLCGVTRTCVSDWRTRLAGVIPSRHRDKLFDIAKQMKKKLSYEDMRG
jgi:hypothetical protein